MTDFSVFAVDLDTARPNPNDNTQVLRGDAPRTAFTKYNDMLEAIHGVVRHIGPESPSPTSAWMQWLDTSVEPPVERERNGANTAWITRSGSLVFDDAGNVGIGRVPTAKLDVQGSRVQFLSGTPDMFYQSFGRASEDLRLTVVGAPNQGVDGSVAGDSVLGSNKNLWLGSGTASTVHIFTNGLSRVAVGSGGAIGFGVTPNVKLHGHDSGNTCYLQLTSSVTGSTINDGFIIGTGSTGEGVILNRENTAIRVHTNNTERLIITADGKHGIGASDPTTLLDVNSNTFRLRQSRTPASATAPGNTGDHCWDASYEYRCVAPNSWQRWSRSTW